MEKISKHISYKEAVRSTTAIRYGIKNVPNEKALERMKLVAMHTFEPPRVHFGVRCNINSFFRSPVLNKKVGSTSPNHVWGESIDADRDKYLNETWNGMKVTNKMWFEYIYWNCEFRELIWEYGNEEDPEWIHTTYREGGNTKTCKIAESGKGYRVFDPIAEGYISATKPDYC